MTQVITTAVLRPQTVLMPTDIRQGLMFRGLIASQHSSAEQKNRRVPVWFVVQSLSELNGDKIVYGTSYDDGMFAEVMCFLSDIFILGWGSEHPRATNPVIPALVPEVCAELRKMQRLATARAGLAESRAAGMKRGGGNTLALTDVEAGLCQKAEHFAQRTRMAANTITKNLQAWGLL
jgi:hypothetical protein